MRLRWKSRRPRALAYLILLSVLIVLGGLVLRDGSMVKTTRLEAERYESATAWPVLQARVEVARFREALARHVAGDAAVTFDNVLMRFDILWSRVPLLDTELVLPIELDGLTVDQAKTHARSALETLDRKLAGLRDARGRFDLLARADALLEPVASDLQSLLVGFQVERHRLFEATRQGILQLGRHHALTVSGFFLVASLLLAMSLLEAQGARRAERRFRHFAMSASDLLWEVNERFQLTFVSERKGGSFCSTGADVSQSGPGLCVGAWDRLTSAETPTREWQQHLRDLAAHRPFRNVRRKFVNSSGEVVTWQASGTPIFDGAGRFRGYRGVASDITPKLEQEERIQYLAEHDPLTGLLNRTAAQACLTQMLADARRRGGGFVLMVLDLDGFNNVNDTHGHHVGDAALAMIGSRLREAVPEAELVARIGGDEFAVAFVPRSLDHRDIELVADRLLASLDRPISVGGKELLVNACAGLAVFPRDGMTVDRLLKGADLALFAAKDAITGRIRFYDRSLLEEAERRRQIERALKVALETGGIDVHYQPLVCLQNGATLAFEALARWEDPILGRVPPGVFVPIAEQTNLIDDIGRCVLRRACCDAAAWQGPLAGASVSVNLSPAQFRTDVAALVDEALALSGLHPSRLILEITETVLMQDSGETLRTLNALSAQGVELAIDDFGAGYTSLAYLKKFPVHKIKLDRSFVSDLEDSADSRLIIEAMVKLAHVLGLATVAEGVETEGQLQFLKSVGCDQVQGYLLGRPAPLDGVLARRLREAAEEMRRGPQPGAAPEVEMLPASL